MVIDLPIDVEDELRRLAARQGREMTSLVEEAIRQYLAAAAITDVDAAGVAETQVKLARELP